MDLSVFANATFCFPDLGKEKLCRILVFGNVCFNIVVRINHDNVASRGAVGRTHISFLGMGAYLLIFSVNESILELLSSCKSSPGHEGSYPPRLPVT